MYLYLEMKRNHWILIAQGTQKKLDKMWDYIDKVNDENRPVIIMTVRKLL